MMKFLINTILIFLSVPALADDVYIVKPSPDELAASKITMDILRSKMKDPDAVKFKGIYFVASPKGSILVCGELNGKNSYGGYNGYRKFYGVGNIVDTEETGGNFDYLYDIMCVQNRKL